MGWECAWEKVEHYINGHYILYLGSIHIYFGGVRWGGGLAKNLIFM